MLPAASGDNPRLACISLTKAPTQVTGALKLQAIIITIIINIIFFLSIIVVFSIIISIFQVQLFIY